MSNTDIDPLGKFVTNTQYIARIEGGLQSSQPTGSERKVEIQSDNGGDVTKLTMNSAGIDITLPSNDGSHSFGIENYSANIVMNIPSGPLLNTGSLSLGPGAGGINQGTGSTAIGGGAGFVNQGANATAIGGSSGFTGQSTQGTAIGFNSGNTSQGNTSTSIGVNAAQLTQGDFAVALGSQAGKQGQGNNTVAISYAGTLNQGANSIAVGQSSGLVGQGINSVTLGAASGSGTGIQSVCVGYSAGANFNQDDTVIIGYNAARGAPAPSAVVDNGIGSTCIGTECKHRGTYGISLGYEAAGKVTYPTDDNGFYIGTQGLTTAIDHSINSQTTTGSNFRLLSLNTKDGEIKFVAPTTSPIPSLPVGGNVKQLTFNTSTGQLGYQP